jgi:hypothetical protein
MLEKYLRQAERLLKNHPITVKSEILAEIAQDFKQNLSLEKVENCVNEKLVKRGLAPLKKSISLGKWIFMTTLASMALGFLAFWFFISQFFPLFSFDEKKGRLLILGGKIDINTEQGISIVGSNYQSNLNTAHTYTGTQTVSTQGKLNLTVQQGVINIKVSENSDLNWDCKVMRTPEKNYTTVEKSHIEMDLDDLGAIECDLFVPKSLSLKVDMDLGRILIDKSEFPADISLRKGIIIFQPNSTLSYSLQTTPQLDLNSFSQFDLQNTNGIKTTLSIIDGVIQVE